MEYKKWRQGIYLPALLLILAFAGIGCGDSRQPNEPVHTSQLGGTERASKTGALSLDYFLEEDGIVVSSEAHFLYADWEPVEFDYICTNPTCSHLIESCSARTFSGEGEIAKDFSLLYEDRLIILHGYSRQYSGSPEEGRETITVYQTDVYEADLDGSNRRKVAAFLGGIDVPTVTYAAVLADGKLYFGGPTELRLRIVQDTQSGKQEVKEFVSAAFYCLDLSDYTLETFTVMENKEGAPTYLYQVFEYDGMIYWMINFGQDNSAILYRSEPASDECEEILRFDSCEARFAGAIGDTVYYWYENSRNTLYARDITVGAEERRFMTVPQEDMFAVPFILDGQLLIRTDCCMEEPERMAEYTVFDSEGNVLDTIRYDAYIDFLDVVGDKIIYLRLDSGWEVWWTDKENLSDLLEKGVQVGPYIGSKLDDLGK